MDLSWLKASLPRDQKLLIEKTETMSQLVEGTVRALRKVYTEMRPAMLDDLGLSAAIEWQAEEFQRRTGIKCEVTATGRTGLDPALATALFRVLQETLDNVERHAGASTVKVSLAEEGGNLLLEITDDGRGMTKKQMSSSRSVGLIGMRERVHPWGGRVKIRSPEGKGTTVAVEVPLHPRETAPADQSSRGGQPG